MSVHDGTRIFFIGVAVWATAQTPTRQHAQTEANYSFSLLLLF